MRTTLRVVRVSICQDIRTIAPGLVLSAGTVYSRPMAKKLSSVPVYLRADLRVEWIPEKKPVALPYMSGTVFLTRGPVAMVRWDGNPRLEQVAVGALQLI